MTRTMKSNLCLGLGILIIFLLMSCVSLDIDDPRRVFIDEGVDEELYEDGKMYRFNYNSNTWDTVPQGNP